MQRSDFRNLFKSEAPVVLPVIHVLDASQVERNIEVLVSEGAQGCFLINHDFGIDQFIPILEEIRPKFPSLWIGVNFLATTALLAIPILEDLKRRGFTFDGYWADDGCIDETKGQSEQQIAQRIAALRQSSEWKGFYTGGVCFKKQRPVQSRFFESAARLATGYMDAICTSGEGTGISPDIEKILDLRRGAGESALLVASGINPDNAVRYAPYVDGFMVATGINIQDDFYNIDASKLKQLLAFCRHGVQQP